jgi:hypothetical protein
MIPGSTPQRFTGARVHVAQDRDRRLNIAPQHRTVGVAAMVLVRDDDDGGMLNRCLTIYLDERFGGAEDFLGLRHD